MTKQIKNKNIFSLMRKKNYIWIICMTIKIIVSCTYNGGNKRPCRWRISERLLQNNVCFIVSQTSGKMQLLGIKPDQFFRNRLTHSLEVAQIARSIAYELGYSQEESFVVEAGALAHDIGNPPFGHSGERKLHELFEHAGGFEGNAQTLRILTSVEKKRKIFKD